MAVPDRHADLRDHGPADGSGREPTDRLCSSGHGAPLSGMVTMYLLMSAFHSPPWLNLICGPPDPQNPRQVRGSVEAVEDAEPLGRRNISTQSLCSKGENDERRRER